MSVQQPVFYIDDSIPINNSLRYGSSDSNIVTVSGVVEVSDAEFGSCYKFSPGAYFEVTTLTCPPSFTFALWVKREVTDEGRRHTLIEFDDNKPQFCLSDLKPSLYDKVIADTRLTRDAWQHVAISFAAATKECVLYVDGVRVAAAIDPNPTTGTGLRIGRGKSAANYPFEGKMAHIIIYDRVLPAAEIQQVMDLTHKTLKPELLLRDTTQLAAGIVRDDSGHSNDGTAVAMTAFNDPQMGPCFVFGAGSITRAAYLSNTSFTLSAWVKAGTLINESAYSLIDFGPSAPKLFLHLGKLKITRNGESADNIISGSWFYPTNEWHHVAVTFNYISKRVKVYIDGKWDQGYSQGYGGGSTGLVVGKAAVSGLKFPGWMAHIAVHDIPLSLKDIDIIRAYAVSQPWLHLPLGAMDANASTPDISTNGRAATGNGVAIVNDRKFGTALSFDGVNDDLQIAGLTCPASFTFAAYIYPDSTIATLDVPLVAFGTGQPVLGLVSGKLRLFEGAIADNPLKSNTWHHVAATYDAATKKVMLFVDGEPAILAAGTFTGTVTGSGLGIGHYGNSGWFKGRMRHVMVYGRVLTQTDVRQIIANTQPPDTIDPSVLVNQAPGLLSMDLSNDEDESVLYIQSEGSQRLSLSVVNAAGSDIQLTSSTLPVQADNYHFQLHFRQGTLHAGFRDALIEGTSEAITTLNQLGWALDFRDLGTGGDVISLLWSGTVVAPKAGDPPYLLDGKLKANARVLLPIVGVQVSAGAGSRTSRVLMRYNNLKFSSDTTVVPPGQRMELLNILYRSQASVEFSTAAEAFDQAQRALGDALASISTVETDAQAAKTQLQALAGNAGSPAQALTNAITGVQASISSLGTSLGTSLGSVVNGLMKDQLTINGKLPIEIKLTDAPAILNDGGANTFKFTIKNLYQVNEVAAQLSLGVETPPADESPKFYLSIPKLFDTLNGSTSTAATNAALDNGTGAKMRVDKPAGARDWTCLFDTAASQAQKPQTRWILKPPAGNTFLAGETVTVIVENLKTTELNSTVYLTVGYDDILNYGEGEFHVPIQVAPLSFNRINGRDTVVIRHGDNTTANPGNEALFVETSEGMAARFYSSAAAAALRVEQNGTGRAAEFVGGGVSIEDVSLGSNALKIATLATSTAAAVAVNQTGTGTALSIQASTANVNNAASNPTAGALWVTQQGTGPALGINQTLATNSTAALFVNQQGTGNAATFIGGGGVNIENPSIGDYALHVKTQSTSTTAALRVEQNGNKFASAAQFSGGGGVIIENVQSDAYALQVNNDHVGASYAAVLRGGLGLAIWNVRSTSTAINIPVNTEKPAIAVTQSGAGYAAQFWGDTGVYAEKLDVHKVRYEGTAKPAANTGTPLLQVGNMDNKSVYLWQDTLVARFHGRIEWYSYGTLSDVRLKEDIQPLNGVLEKALRLRGVSYRWKSSPEGPRCMGFIAQEVEEVFPDIVSPNAEGFKTITGDSFVPVLLEAVRELKNNHQAQIDDLQLRIRRLEDQLLLNGNGEE